MSTLCRLRGHLSRQRMGDTHVRVQIGREEEKQLQAPLSAEAEDKDLWAPLSSPLRAVALGSFKSLFLARKVGMLTVLA